MKDKKEKEPEWKKIHREYQDAINNFSEAIMKTLTPVIKEATENIKNLNIGDKLELIQDDENESKN